MDVPSLEPANEFRYKNVETNMRTKQKPLSTKTIEGQRLRNHRKSE